MAVLLLGIIPPLIIYGIIRAVEAAVERTRIRELGLADPLAAAQALNKLKMREQSPTMMMTALSVGGVGVGVMALIVVLSVMSGFEIDLQQKILGTNAHAVVSKYAGDLPEYPKLMEKIAKVPRRHRPVAVHRQPGDDRLRGQRRRRGHQGHRPQDGGRGDGPARRTCCPAARWTT